MTIPEGWAFDKDGNVTTNAKDALKDYGSHRRIQGFGGV